MLSGWLTHIFRRFGFADVAVVRISDDLEYISNDFSKTGPRSLIPTGNQQDSKKGPTETTEKFERIVKKKRTKMRTWYMVLLLISFTSEDPVTGDPDQAFGDPLFFPYR